MTRLQSWGKVEIGRNYYGRPCPARESITIRGDVREQAMPPYLSVDKYANVWQNIHVGNSESGGGGPGQSINPQSSPLDGPVHIIFESNACWLGITSAGGCFGASEASNVTVRNMIADGKNHQMGSTVHAVNLTWDMNALHPQPTNTNPHNE